jgi:hypothetical protein
MQADLTAAEGKLGHSQTPLRLGEAPGGEKGR